MSDARMPICELRLLSGMSRRFRRLSDRSFVIIGCSRAEMEVLWALATICRHRKQSERTTSHSD